MLDMQCILTPLLSVSSQVKAAFTRAYNKEVHLTPYSLQAVKKGRRGGGGAESELGGEDVDNEAQEAEDEGLNTDAMIKVRAVTMWMPRTLQRPFLSVRFSVYMSPVSCSSCSRRRPKPPRSRRRRRRRRTLGRTKARGRAKAKARPRNDRRPEE